MEYKKYINDFKTKGIEEGITRFDYKKLLELSEQLSNDIYNKNSLTYLSKELIIELKELENIMYLVGETFNHEATNYEKNNYIMSHSIISGIAFANRKSSAIKLYGSDSYMYLCNFHNEKTPSLGVSDYCNLFYCFGCGERGNIFTYLMEYENLQFVDSVYLLAKINNIELPNNKFDDNDELVKKYRSAITSDEYLKVLKRALDRNFRRNKTIIYNRLVEENQSMEEYFERKFEIIDRIKTGKKDEKFILVPENKIVFLEKEKVYSKERTILSAFE